MIAQQIHPTIVRHVTWPDTFGGRAFAPESCGSDRHFRSLTTALYFAAYGPNPPLLASKPLTASLFSQDEHPPLPLFGQSIFLLADRHRDCLTETN